jgi:hypothetical protein
MSHLRLGPLPIASYDSQKIILLKIKLSYGRRSVGQSLLLSSYLLGHATNLSFSSRIFASNIYVFYYRAHSDERTAVQFNRTIATGPPQRSHSPIQVPLTLRPYLIGSFETGSPFCRLLQLTGLQWWYCNPPPHGV